MVLLRLQTLHNTHPAMSGLCPSNTPWMGILSLAGMMTCVITSAIVVGVSHNKAVASWKIQPAVLLAVLSGTSSVLFACALEAGIAVRFWLGASSHTSLSQLHYIWDHGRGFGLIPALRAGSKARNVALLATGAYILHFLASPLLQRSTYQSLHDEVSIQPMSMDIAARIPDGWFGPRDANGAGLFEFGNGLSELQQWWRKDPISTQDRAGYRCDGTCDTQVQAAGFRYDCWTAEEKLDLITGEPDDQVVFFVGMAMTTQNITDEPLLYLLTRYLSEVDTNCIGTVQVKTCYLKAATVNYAITIQNTTISLPTPELLNMSILSSYSSPEDFPDAPTAGPLVSLRNFVYNILVQNTTNIYNKKMNKTAYGGQGSLADIFFVSSSENQDPSPPTCRIKFRSPTEYVLSVMYEFMFRFALAAGKGAETQTLTARRTSRTLVHQVDAVFLAVSLAAMTCGIVLVGALIWNWWLLGRPVTLSPLETAGALGRPILDDRPCATIDQILVGTREMKFEPGSLGRTWSAESVAGELD